MGENRSSTLPWGAPPRPPLSLSQQPNTGNEQRQPGWGRGYHPQLLPLLRGCTVSPALGSDKGLAHLIPCRGRFVATVTIENNDKDRQHSLGLSAEHWRLSVWLLLFRRYSTVGLDEGRKTPNKPCFPPLLSLDLLPSPPDVGFVSSSFSPVPNYLTETPS